MTFVRYSAAAGLVVAAACIPDLTVTDPQRVQITCGSDAECPPEMRCSETLSRCVVTSTDDETPPEITGGVLVRVDTDPLRDVIGPNQRAEIEFMVTEALGQDPDVQLIWSGSQKPAAMVSKADPQGGEPGPTYIYEYIADPNDAEGFVSLGFGLIDLAGLNSRVEFPKELQVDKTAPSIAPSTASVVYTPGPGNPLPSVTAGRADTVVRMLFAASETLALAGAVTLVSPDGNTRIPAGMAQPSIGTLYSIPDFTILASMMEGRWTVELELVDLAGNREAAAVDPDLELDVITTPPPLVDVATDGLVTYARTPWGSGNGATTEPPAFSLMGGINAAQPGAVVIAYDRSDLSTAFEIGRATAASDGSFSMILAASDRDAVYVSQTDRAGNRSAALAVRDGVWTATLIGKIAGRDVPNPHSLFLNPRFSADLLTLERLEPIQSQMATLATNDAADVTGNVLPVTPTRLWTERSGAVPAGGQLSAIAFARGHGTLTFGGLNQGGITGDFWQWDGFDWRPLVVPGIAPPPRAGAGVAYDAVRDRLILAQGAAGAAQALRDVWEYDGSRWLQATPPSGNPPGRLDGTMVYHAAERVSIFFGGMAPLNVAMMCDAGTMTAMGMGCLLNDTWAWDGTAWTELCPAGACGADPPPRVSHDMAYDPERETVVLFGGCNESPIFPGCGPGTNLDDTWELTLPTDWRTAGGTWTQRNPTTAPAARYGHAMAFDTTHGEVILFGGCTDGRINECMNGGSDLWRWDPTGNTWSCELGDEAGVMMNVNCPAPGAEPVPPARGYSSVAWDQSRNELLVLSGLHNVGAPGMPCGDGTVSTMDNMCEYVDQWTYEPASGGPGTWRVSARAGVQPIDRDEPEMAYDEETERTIFYGGRAPSGRVTCEEPVLNMCGSVWEWDGLSWSQSCRFTFDTMSMTGDHSCDAGNPDPDARIGHGMSWAGNGRGVAVLGGRCHAGGAEDWCMSAPGGCSPGEEAVDLYFWDGMAGKWVAGMDPPCGVNGLFKREKIRAAYDEAADQLVVFGGIYKFPTQLMPPPTYAVQKVGDEAYYIFCDTWTYSLAGGGTWNLESSVPGCASGVPARFDHTMAYDAIRGRVVMYGGCDEVHASMSQADQCMLGLSDTWEWNGSTWTEITNAGNAGVKVGARMSFDRYRGRILLDGGGQGDGADTDDVYEYDGSTWNLITPPFGGPGAHREHAGTFDQGRQQLQVVLGEASTSMWELSLEPDLRPTAVFDVAFWAANRIGEGPDAADVLSVNVVAYVAAEGYDNSNLELPLTPATVDPNRLLGAGVQVWNGQVSRWEDHVDECTARPTGTPAPLSRLEVPITDPAQVAEILSGELPHLFVRVVPCSGSGNHPNLARLWVDYLEATVTYRTP